LHLFISLGSRKGLVLRETCDGNIEIVAIITPNVLNKVNAVNESIFGGFPFIFSLWWITSQGQDIAASMTFCFLVCIQ
jgi:hypothetical protein